jgi:hypothetical protein
MTLKDLICSSTVVKVAIILWLVSTGFVVFFLGQIDLIVHKELYDYGLQFSTVWATTYWSLMRSIYVCLTIPSLLSGTLLLLGILKRGGGERRPIKREEKPTSSKPQPVVDNHLFATCPKCKKVFSKPLTMLDFSHGKTRLVNVCPYCNYILGNADEEKNLTELAVPEVHAEEITP